MKISLVTACRNAANTLGLTLESVRRQTVDGFDFEYIVVDGASTDGSVDIIRDFERKIGSGAFSFRWVSERDRSLYDGINKGIRMSTGDVVGIVNADDILSEDDTLAQIARAFAGSGGPDVVYGDVRFVRGGESVDAMRRGETVRYCTGRFFRNWMFRFATFPAHPSTYVRRSCFERYGLYSLDYPICADFEMMLRLLYVNGVRAKYLPVCTTVMRTGGVSTNGVKSNLQINREDLRALREHGVWSCTALVYLKYFAKIWGFVFRRRHR